jgi:hypothetical protein
VGSRALHPGLADDFQSGEHLNKLVIQNSNVILHDNSFKT